MTDRREPKKRAENSVNEFPSAKKMRLEGEPASSGGGEVSITIKEENHHENVSYQAILIEDVRTVKKEFKEETKEDSFRDAEVTNENIIKIETNDLKIDTDTITIKIEEETFATDDSAPRHRHGTRHSKRKLIESQSNPTGKVDYTQEVQRVPAQEGGLRIEGIALRKKIKTYTNTHKGAVQSQPEVDPLLIKHLRPAKSRKKSSELWVSQNFSMKQLDFTKTKSWLIGRSVEPAFYFNPFIDDSYLSTIVDATNREALSKKDSRLNFVHLRSWTNLTVSEFRTFLGLLLHTGTGRMAHLGDYWKQHWLFKSCFRDYMTPQRFTVILRYLIIPDCDNDCRLIVDNFNSVMDKIFYPGRNLNMEVNVIDWEHKTMYSQPDRNKLNKSRLVTLCDQDGIVVKMAIEATATKLFTQPLSVLEFLEGKLDSGHSVNISGLLKITPNIAGALLDRMTYCTAINVGDVPKHLLAEELAPGENQSLFCNGVHIGKYNSGSTTTCYLSTEFKDDMKQSKSSQFTEPAAISSHEEKPKTIQRIDSFDGYPCEIDKLPRIKKVFIHSLMMSLLNANLLYNAFSGSTLNFVNYRLKILEHLLPETKSQRDEKEKPTQSKGVNTDVSECDGGGSRRKLHKLSKIPQSRQRTTKGGNVVRVTARRQCKNCMAAKNRRLMAIYQCTGCVGAPVLCMDCFFEIHKVTLY